MPKYLMTLTLTNDEDVPVRACTVEHPSSSLRDLKSFGRLKKFVISGVPLADLRYLAALTGLRELVLQPYLEGTADALPQLPDLTRLFLIDACPYVDHVTAKAMRTIVDKVPKLQSFAIEGRCGCFDVGPLSDLKHLKHLSLSSTTQSSSLDFAGLTGLESLRIDSCYYDQDFSPFAALTALTRLILPRFFDGVEAPDLSSALGGLTCLRELSIPGGYGDLSWLADLPELERLAVCQHDDVDLPDLVAGMKHLTHVDVDVMALPQLEKLAANLPDLVSLTSGVYFPCGHNVARPVRIDIGSMFGGSIRLEELRLGFVDSAGWAVTAKGLPAGLLILDLDGATVVDPCHLPSRTHLT